MSQGAVVPAKVVMLGASGVGKSSLVLRFVLDKFSDNTEATIGAAFLTKSIVFEDYTLKFEIWDTAGQERFKSLAPMYYRNSRVAIVVYDISNPESFEKAKEWVEEFRATEQNTERVVALVGNKADLNGREIPTHVAQQYADSSGLIYIETSAKESTNVNKLFETIAPRLPRPRPGMGMSAAVMGGGGTARVRSEGNIVLGGGEASVSVMSGSDSSSGKSKEKNCC